MLSTPEHVVEEAENDSDSATRAKLGQALRDIRQRRGHTLATVSSETGISTSFLSILENGRTDITIGRLLRLLAFYDAVIGDLFPGRTAEERLITRRGEEIALESPSEGLQVRLLAPDTRRAMMPVLAIHEPGSRMEGMRPHDGEVFVHVIEGTVLFERPEQPPFILSTGDSAYYDAKGLTPPAVTNIGHETARVIAVITPPTA